MNNGCSDLYLLSTLACRLAECLDNDELSVLATSLTALGDMLEVVIARQAACKNDEANAPEPPENDTSPACFPD
ncbi:MAG: DUF6774 domain-containing protein [Coprococcus sp.]